VGGAIGVTLLPPAMVEIAGRAGQEGVPALPPEDAIADTVFVRRRDVSSVLSPFIAAVGPARSVAQAVG